MIKSKCYLLFLLKTKTYAHFAPRPIIPFHGLSENRKKYHFLLKLTQCHYDKCLLCHWQDRTKMLSLHYFVTCQYRHLLCCLSSFSTVRQGVGQYYKNLTKQASVSTARSASVSVALDRRLSAFWRASDCEGEKRYVIFYFSTVHCSWVTDRKASR